MGFAKIVSGGEKGEYVVELDFGQPLVNAKLAQAAADLVKLAGKVTQAQGKYNEAKAKENEKQVLANDALEAYITAQNVPAEGATANQIKAKAATLQAYNKALADLMTERGKVAPLLLALDMAKSNEAMLKKMQNEWQGLQLTETRTAWCADLTEDASGQVATIEVPGEDKLVLIAPSAPAPSEADGVMTAREIQGPAQVFWNAAVLPGWQKWKPTYRRGTITALDYEADTASVTLFDDVSSAQKLGINQTPTLHNVPVEYMQCDAQAFAVGDVCVVKFVGQDWAAPKVIGFCSNPKTCFPKQIFVRIRAVNDANYVAVPGRQLLTGPHADIHYDSNRAWGVFATWRTRLQAFAARAPYDWGGSGLQIHVSTAPIYDLPSNNGTADTAAVSHYFLIGPDTVTMPSGEQYTAAADTVMIITTVSPLWPTETWSFSLPGGVTSITGEHWSDEHGKPSTTATPADLAAYVAAGVPPAIAATLGSTTKQYTFNPDIAYSTNDGLVYELVPPTP